MKLPASTSTVSTCTSVSSTAVAVYSTVVWPSSEVTVYLTGEEKFWAVPEAGVSSALAEQSIVGVSDERSRPGLT